MSELMIFMPKYKKMNICIIGAGSWGTAIAILLGRAGKKVFIAGRNKEDINNMKNLQENLHYARGYKLPANVHPILIDQNTFQSDNFILAVPCDSILDSLTHVPESASSIIIASKGFDKEKPYLLNKIVQQKFPNAHVGILSGPNLALEMIRDVPSASVIACSEIEFAESLANIFRSPTIRVDTTTDVIGVELAGALKNVYAIGSGICDGLGYGQNTKALVITRGLREMVKLGVAMGADPATFMGLAGVGDLFATAQSQLSRNYRVGLYLASGKKIEKILEDLGQVAEGVPTSKIALELAKEYNVEMPLVEMISAIINGEIEPQRAVSLLMSRPAPSKSKAE